MCSDEEQQLKEIEVLKSIYEGDENFKEINSKTYQYKYTDGDKSFIVEISWGPTYPTDKPDFNVDIFYNQNILPAVKESILSILNTEAEQWIGCAMTYTLFECLKERVGEVLAEQTEEAIVARVEKVAIVQDPDETEKKPEIKKEQLTKAQKRRAWDKAEMGKAQRLGLGGHCQAFISCATPATSHGFLMIAALYFFILDLFLIFL